VLEYAIRYAERFTPSDVVVYAREECDLEIDNRRIYDATCYATKIYIGDHHEFWHVIVWLLHHLVN
jgi:hypothetical protein